MNNQVAQRMPPATPVTGVRRDLVRTVIGPHLVPIKKLRQFKQYHEWLPVTDLPTDSPDDRHRAIAAERWQFIPDFRELLDATDAFGRIFIETDDLNIRVLIGLMLDGLPSAKTLQSVGYADTLALLLSDEDADEGDYIECYSALVVAAAAVEVWRTATFVPSPAEFLAIAKKKRREFHRAYVVAHRLYDLRSQAETVLVTFGDIKPTRSGHDDDDIPF